MSDRRPVQFSRLRAPAPRRELSATWLLLLLAGLTFLGHMLVAGNYGYFRDELYYLADGRHLQAGYVDQPALMGWLAALMRLIAGDGLVAIHVIPALACALIVVVTGLIARELGGDLTAQLVAGAAAMFAPVLMATGSLFSMDVLDQLWWALGSLVLVRLLRREEPEQWLLFGLIAAFGFLTKLTILFFGLAVALALLATRERRQLLTRWPWLAAGIAFLGLAPYLVWNALNGWPTLEFYRNYRYLTTGPLSFFASQIALMNPLALPLVVGGLVFYFRKAGARFRLLGWSFLFLYLILTALHGKPYFLGPAYPMLFAGGAVVFEEIRPRGWIAWARPAYLALIALAGLAFAPLAMPILPPALFARGYGALVRPADSTEAQSTKGVFPQNLGDRFGWRSLTRTVERVYTALPAGERAQACVFTGNYGEASALSFLATPGKMPRVISGQNNYYLWGPGDCTGRVLILVGIPRSAVERASSSFAHVAVAATHRCLYCVANEQDLPIYVLSDPKDTRFDLARVWPLLKHFD